MRPWTTTRRADKDYARITLFSAPLPYTVTINNQITNSISYGSRYERDWTGEYAYYTDEYVFQQAGKPGCHCSTERIFYDAQTGEEILREHLSDDVYNPLDAHLLGRRAQPRWLHRQLSILQGRTKP